MKKICEIYDLSKDYDLSEHTAIIIVSDLDKHNLFRIIPDLEFYSNTIMNTTDWNNYMEINNVYSRNENKFYMREVRKSQKAELNSSAFIYVDEISNIFENKEMKNKIDYALSFLEEQPKKGFCYDILNTVHIDKLRWKNTSQYQQFMSL